MADNPAPEEAEEEAPAEEAPAEPEAAPAAEDDRFEVVATAKGYFQHMRAPGSRFRVTEAQFSSTWMAKV